MENLFIKVDFAIKKAVLSRYEYMGAHFQMLRIPEKLSFFTKLKLKKYLRLFCKSYVYSDRFDISQYKCLVIDGSLCLSENIEILCRKICKNKAIAIPPIVGISDEIFSENSVSILNGLGRFCSEIYIFTKSSTAHGYAEYMLSEYGCMVYVEKEEKTVDILITTTHSDNTDSIKIDLFEKNCDTENCVNNVTVYLGAADEYIAPIGVVDKKLYDFLRFSGMNYSKKIKILRIN